MPYVTSSDIERIVGKRIQQVLKDRIDIKYPLQYDEELNWREDWDFLRKVQIELDKELKVAGEHRHDDWESGWAENRDEFKKTKDIESLIPKYHTRPVRYHRYDKRIIASTTPLFDYRLNSFIVDSIVSDKICNTEFNLKVFEFGCGTGHHLLRLKEYFAIFANLKWFGLDWATSSQDILNGLDTYWPEVVRGHNFDFFSPDYSIDCSDSLVYTVASLEQIGSKHEELIQYWLKNKPSLIINFEPIKEVLDENNPLDKLSLMYMDKRGYLDGYLTRLQQLEKEGKLEIQEVRRFYCGSQFIEGHTCIIWKPL
jgi:hypothetical protein